MKKKYLIYLLTLVMILSPAAAFAGAEDGAEGESPDAEVVLDQETPVEEEVVDQEAPAVTEEEVVEEDVVTEEPVAEAEEPTPSNVKEKSMVLMADTPETGWDETKTHYYKDGVLQKGLFKGKMDNAKESVALFYADSDGVVEKRVGTVKVEGLEQGKYFSFNGRAFDYDDNLKSPVTYFQKYDSDFNCYCMDEEAGFKTSSDNKTYYLNANGTVQTDAGIITVEVKKYYINEDGTVKTTVGFTPDHKYYVEKATGEIHTAQGIFKANDGKTYFFNAGGEVASAAGLYAVGSTQYYVNSDGVVQTTAGFITVGSKRYLVQNGGAISKKAGTLSFAGSMYAANSDGSIITKTGFVTTGGKIYYVTNGNGVLAVNKLIKVSGTKYHATTSGALAIGVHKWRNYYYYSNSKGAVRTKKGIVKWAGNRYYVGKKGKITTNKKFTYKKKTYISKKNGAFRKGIFTWKKNMYYANSKGVVRTKAGAFSYDGSRYFSRKGGKLYKNQLITSGSKKYLAGKDGKLKSGLLQWKRALYLTDAKCQIFTKAGMYTYGKKQYYVKKGGKIAVSQFVKFNDKHYYAGSDGAIMKKSFKYGGVKITPNSKTGEISDEEYWKVFPNEAPQPEPAEQA